MQVAVPERLVRLGRVTAKDLGITDQITFQAFDAPFKDENVLGDHIVNPDGQHRIRVRLDYDPSMGERTPEYVLLHELRHCFQAQTEGPALGFRYMLAEALEALTGEENLYEEDAHRFARENVERLVAKARLA